MTDIQLYQTNISLSKNAKIDNMPAYLSKCAMPYHAPDCQYIKIGTDITITIKANQVWSEIPEFNYAVIRQDGRIYYYFVLGANWASQGAVELMLSMDTINTWWDELSWNPKTHIIREHMDRWAPASQDLIYPIIDPHNEGLNPVTNYKYISRDISGVNSSIDSQYYLVYKTRDAITTTDLTNPISNLLFSNSAFKIREADDTINDPVINVSPGWDGDGHGARPKMLRTIFLSRAFNNNDAWFKIGYKGWDIQTGTTKITWYDPEVLGGTRNENGETQICRAVRFDFDGSNPDQPSCGLHFFWYVGDSYPYTYRGETTKYVSQNAPVIQLHGIPYMNIQNNFDCHIWTSLSDIDAKMRDSKARPSKLITTATFDKLDRSESRLMRILTLPYSPIDISYNAKGELILPHGWSFHVGYRSLLNTLDTGDVFSSKLERVIMPPLSIKRPHPTGAEAIARAYESKLWSSEFTTAFFSYDGVNTPIKFERWKFPNDNFVDVDFNVSTALSSNLYFKLNYQHTQENQFDDILYSSRSLELPIYNSGYVDYLRNGYNYDKENLNIQNRIATTNAIISGVSGAVQAVGGALSLAGPIKSYVNASKAVSGVNKPLSSAQQAFTNAQNVLSAGGEMVRGEFRHFDPRDLRNEVNIAQGHLNSAHANVNSAMRNKQKAGEKLFGIGQTYATDLIAQSIGTVSTILNTVESVNANNRAFQHNLQNLQSQNVNVIGTSDADLFTSYQGNKLWFNVYRPNREILDNVAKVFYYTGYNHPLQELPKFVGRYWFNFVQCEPVFNDEETCIYSNYIKDIKARFELGITIYHEHNGNYDLNQTKENWENWLVA